ncbi:MAG: response regulator transcription factor [Desulfobulbaceae bacterium]|nr:response regulator transcription factor [Desulfobulbaceae bacterium]
MRIAIVEDNSLLRENLVLLIGGEPELKVCGNFGTAEEALPAVLRDKPDILLVDLGLPGMSGAELIRRVKAKHQDIEIMVHTAFDARDTVFSAIKAGATGYILKGATPRELIESIHNLAGGGAPMSPKIARAVIGEFQDVDNDDQYLLTAREKEILLGLEKGFTYNQLGNELSISPHTIHSHIKKIYEKLHAKSRREALTKARKKGII